MSSVYDARIRAATDKYLPGVDWRLLKAQYMAESKLDPSAVSPAGARGIAQFMPDTWGEMVSELGYQNADPHNPTMSIDAGAYYMAELINGWTSPRPDIDRHCLAMASYNCGFGNMLKAQKLANNANDYASIIRARPGVKKVKAAEPTAYVKRILRYYSRLVTG